MILHVFAPKFIFFLCWIDFCFDLFFALEDFLPSQNVHSLICRGICSFLISSSDLLPCYLLLLFLFVLFFVCLFLFFVLYFLLCVEPVFLINLISFNLSSCNAVHCNSSLTSVTFPYDREVLWGSCAVGHMDRSVNAFAHFDHSLKPSLEIYFPTYSPKKPYKSKKGQKHK